MEIDNNRIEKLFLSERCMAVVCAFIAAAGLLSLVLFRGEMELFEIFGLPVPWSHNWVVFRK